MAKQIKNILINSIHDKALKNAVEQFINGRLIDIGCGAKPYKNLLAPFVTEHIGVDHQETLHEKSNIDRFGTVYNIPAKDEEFDCALCTAVLEHLAEPELALKECWRVLKRGGVAIYSVPFIWHLHEEPKDFYRFFKIWTKISFSKSWI